MRLIHSQTDFLKHFFGLSIALVVSMTVNAGSPEPAQVQGLGPWVTTPVFTIGETMNGYTPPGIPDGMGAFERPGTVEIIVNHELKPGKGYVYRLANGTGLKGARITKLVFDKKSRELVDMGPAYDTIYNRNGEPVSDANPLTFGDLNRLCSAGSYAKGLAGFEDDIFLAGEETKGGTEFALDVENGKLWAAPSMGRAGWESVAALKVAELNRTHVAIMIGDDRGDAALLLYVGEKQPKGNFLERNGLAKGRLYMWVAENGDLSPVDWNGNGTTRSGKFVEVVNHADEVPAGAESRYDELGFATQEWLDEQRKNIGAFRFSRPEDLHTNPGNGQQVVFTSTGRNTDLNQGKDRWGTTYLVDIKINPARIRNGYIEADIRILYDGDDAINPDLGIRSPDNLVWADDGFIYIQEDRSIGDFGRNGGGESTIWQLDPETGKAGPVGRVNRLAIPAEGYDTNEDDQGNWETSGIIDVTDEFNAKDERLMFFNVQAHSLRGTNIDTMNLVEGGQFAFLSKPEDTANDYKD